MPAYDPERAPDPQAWLALDEQLRIRLAEKFHRKARVELPSIKAHAAIHAMVENQVALAHPPVVRAMQRLAQQGLSRHDCIHAVGWVLAQNFHEVMSNASSDSASTVQARYDAAVERLTAAGWRAQVEE
jgi:hypothetical protein